MLTRRSLFKRLGVLAAAVAVAPHLAVEPAVPEPVVEAPPVAPPAAAGIGQTGFLHLPTDPRGARDGAVIFDTTSTTLFVYDTGAWHAVEVA